ncbi:MAG: isoprenylcysteine carboxylmethyltransferase family protein [Spirochaetia bacterium]|nr:isoprenylcysteine carboxylmethyltransferase family protein [Spirochaetia bacterium]
MKQFVLAFGNFFFKWRDTAFSLIFLAAFFSAGIALLNPDGYNGDVLTSIAGLVLALAGQFVRAITIGYAYIKRGGLNKKIYAETLQNRGVFAHTRNPMYLGNLLLVTGAMVSINNLAFYILALPLFYFIYYSIIAAEEDFLGKKFGNDYERYKSEVRNRILPGNLSKWSATVSEMEFSWKRLIRKEHGSMVVIFGGLCLYNITKYHLRYEIPLVAFQGLWIAFACLMVFQIISEILKRTGRLAEEG